MLHVCVLGGVSPVLSITPLESRAGDIDTSGDKRTETQRWGQVAVQSSGLAIDSFRKTQTPWNGGGWGELRIKL